MHAPPLLTLTDAELADLATILHRTDLSSRQRERLELVKGAAQGFDLARLCAWSGRTSRTVARWLAAYTAGGIGALIDAPRSGRPRRADDAYVTALEAAVTSEPRAMDQSFDVWTSARLSAYLAETTGVRIAPGWIRVLLHRRGCTTGRPKHSVTHLRDPQEVAACQERLAAAGEKGAGRAGPLRTAF